MTQALQEFITDESEDLAVRTDADIYFGRWTLSMLTLFEITLAPGAWARIGRLLIFEVSPWFSLFFIPYGWGVSFAIVRVISALFLKQTLAVTANDPETAM